jgi:hypothetical protein
MNRQPEWDLTDIEDSDNKCWEKQDDGKVKLKDIPQALINATLYVGIKKITKKNFKEFNRRLKILRFAGLPVFNMITLKDIESHIGLSTSAKTIDYRSFKNLVYSSIEEGAEILIKEEATPEEGEKEEDKKEEDK